MDREPFMLGYDKAAAAADISAALGQAAGRGGYAALAAELPPLTARLINAHLSYLHECGALDDGGDTGEGDYDEDEAFEYLLDAVAAGRAERDMDALAALVEAFLPAQDAFLTREGLIGE